MRPKAPDKLLDLETVAKAHDADQYMPYWAALWPVSKYLAHTIYETRWVLPVRAIELGCGLGLPGLAALTRGLSVTFTDYDATALRVVAQSVALNGFANAQYLHFDWRSLLTKEAEREPHVKELIQGFDVVIASDLIYEERQVKSLVAAFAKLVKPDGVIFMADQDRPYRELFVDEAKSHGFSIKTWQVPKQHIGGLDVHGTVYILSHSSCKDVQPSRPERWELPASFT
jgi:predicted nicotinamide N-methyase